MSDIISLNNLRDAAARICDYAVYTPVIRSRALNQKLNADIYIKPENLQRTGSFKFRGAFNRLSQLTDTQQKAGVVAWSSGNHAQGIAAAAELLEMPACIVMPSDAPATKMEKTRSYGAEIVEYDRYTESREDIGRRLSEERGAVLVPSFDDEFIITGQGTAGLEFAEQSEQLGTSFDILLVCCGGGGLIAGMSSAFSHLSPKTQVYCVEPAGFDDHVRSLESGNRETIDPNSPSICDALLAPQPGSLTFPINRQLLSGGLVVTDDEVRRAMRYAFSDLKLVLEPGGAVALAAILSNKIDIKGKSIGIVTSGGNVDPAAFSEIIMANDN